MKKNISSQITIHGDSLTFPVSPTLYGLFFEEISHAGDGGLYAELIRNTSFQDSTIPERCVVDHGHLHSPTGWTSPFEEKDLIPGWKILQDQVSKAELALDYQEGLNDQYPVSLRVSAKVAQGGKVGVINEGYWGIPVKQNANYFLSFYAKKQQCFSGVLEIRLESRTGEIYATENLIITSTQWLKYKVTLKSTAEDSEAVLVIATKDSGTFWLELVSLFPEHTWREKRNGLRPDLVQMLEGLKPTFLRFPGGCFVEGFSIETASRWKKTIGDITERSSHWTLWNYRTTNGLGYHEYLQFAEDMGMEMMFVVNCGMTCQGRMGELVPLDELEEWVQDMLDAIEYANGAATSKYGSLRAKNGHAEPFGLKYIEIGNENFGPEYNLRYKIFYDAVKAKYPEIITIFNVHWEVGTEIENLPVEIVDEHFYPDSEFFLMYQDMYDSYDRSGPKVYVGEYAQTVNNEEGTLLGALSEAAFMIGMERNQDIVTMSSYAPLLANVNHTVWNPDLIYFDNKATYGTPSYYVQKLFGENRGHMVVEAEVKTEKKKKVFQGGVAVYLADVNKVKTIKVTKDNEILLRREAISLEEAEQPSDHISIGDASWTEYNVDFKIKLEGTGIRFRFLDCHKIYDKQNYLQWEINKEGKCNLVHIVGWSRVKLAPTQHINVVADEWYEARIEIKEDSVRCYLNNSLIQEYEIREIPYVTSVTTLDKEQKELIVKLVNANEYESNAIIDVKGLEIMTEVEEIILTSSEPSAKNSMEIPLQVSPVKATIKVEGNSFLYNLKPYSLVLLKMKIKA